MKLAFHIMVTGVAVLILMDHMLILNLEARVYQSAMLGTNLNLKEITTLSL